MRVLVTGSGGLVGSEAVKFFCERGAEVFGIDNDSRRYFFGEEGSTQKVTAALRGSYPDFTFYDFDIRDQARVASLFQAHPFDLLIHAAAQPSHDWASREPHTDFTINANGTLNLLEGLRRFSPEAVFIFVSTNKVYGDRPNALPLVELETRYEIAAGHPFYNGVDETMSIDQCLHSLFGSSKLAADVLTQEYGRYFGLKTGIFRAGCITGPSHRGVQDHGFLNYLVKCIVKGNRYTVFGYKGKQVRDNIHAYDLVNAFYYFYQKPRSGEVYNIGGGRHSHSSLIESTRMIEELSGRRANFVYEDKARAGDHVWYVSGVSKFKSHYPEWDYRYTLRDITEEMVRWYVAP